MKAWLVYEREGAERNLAYIDLYKKHGDELGIDFTLVICDEENLPCENPDFAIVRAMRPDITAKIEERKIPAFNNLHISSICNNKARTYEYLSKNKIPVMPWKSAKPSDSPPRMDSYPAVIKPCSGHGGKNVMIIENDDEYEKARKKIFPDEYVIQPLATETGKDMRVYVVGGEIIAAVLRTAKDDFRSNFSLGGQISPKSLSDDERELVGRVCSLFDFSLCGIDIMYHNGAPVINEIEDVVGSRMLYATYDIDIARLHLEHIAKKLSR